MAVTVAQGVGHSMFGGGKRRVFAASNAVDRDSDLPDDPVLFVRKMLAANCSRSRALPWPLVSRKWWCARVAFDVDLRPSR
jgi:hypothetical protein